MANLRQIRSRIRSVHNTQKITRAMQMVAGAKLRRAQEQLFQARPYVDRLEQITQRFLAAVPNLSHPLLTAAPAAKDDDTQTEGKPPAPTALIVIASDTGLCGAYNEKVLTTAQEVFGEALTAAPAQVVPVGRKGLAAARRMGWPILASYTELSGKVTEAFIQELAGAMMTAYREGRV